MRHLVIATAAVAILAGGSLTAQRKPYRGVNDTYAAPQFTSRAGWNIRAAHLKELVLASAGLLPMPERTPLNANVFGDVTRADYIVSKVYFESLPGFFVTGNLYRPIGDGPFPAILSPHGHWAYGRLENSATASVPGRAINLARQGFVVFTYDMIGYNDSWQLEHRSFGGPREKLWGLSMAGLQLWNSIRGLDFLESLPYVQRDKIGATGASGGGTQVFLLAAVDRASRGRRARQHDLAAHAGRLPLRKPAGPAPGYDQCRDRRDDCAAAAADGVGDWRLDDQHARARVSRRARAVCAAGRGRSRARRAIRSAPQLQPRVARGGLRVDGPLAAERARRTCAAKNAPSRPIRCPICWSFTSARFRRTPSTPRN